MPNGWTWIRQSNLCWLDNGNKTQSGELPYLEAKVIRLNKPDKYQTSGVVVDSNFKLILVDGENSGEIFTPPFKGYMGSTFKILDVTSKIDFQYLLLIFELNLDLYRNSKTGAAIPHLNKKLFKENLIALPPLNEQLRIAKKISEFDPLLERYQNIEKELSSYETSFEGKLKASILQYAIEGKLVKQDPKDEPASVLLERIKKEKERLIKEGKIKRDKHESEIVLGDDKNYYKNIIIWPIPKSWCITNLGFIGEWKSGSTPNRSEAKNFVGPIPWLKTGDLNDSLVTNIPEHISEEAFKRNKLRLNPINTILIAMYGATIGKLGILGLPATTNQACCSCIVHKGLNYKYLFYYLMSQKKMLIDKGAGGAQPNISKEKIINHPILVPPYNEQLKIVKKIEHLIDLVA